MKLGAKQQRVEAKGQFLLVPYLFYMLYFIDPLAASTTKSSSVETSGWGFDDSNWGSFDDPPKKSTEEGSSGDGGGGGGLSRQELLQKKREERRLKQQAAREKRAAGAGGKPSGLGAVKKD